MCDNADCQRLINAAKDAVRLLEGDKTLDALNVWGFLRAAVWRAEFGSYQMPLCVPQGISIGLPRGCQCEECEEETTELKSATV